MLPYIGVIIVGIIGAGLGYFIGKQDGIDNGLKQGYHLAEELFKPRVQEAYEAGKMATMVKEAFFDELGKAPPTLEEGLKKIPNSPDKISIKEKVRKLTFKLPTEDNESNI